MKLQEIEKLIRIERNKLEPDTEKIIALKALAAPMWRANQKETNHWMYACE